MALKENLREILNILSGVDGVGRVHEYERFAKDRTKFLELFKDKNDKINAWTITRQSCAEREGASETYEESNLFIVRGYYSLDDDAASELKFQEIIENIRAAFREEHTLNGTCETTSPDFGPETGAGIQVRIIEPRLFFGVLCHYCELALGVQNLIEG